MPLDNFVIQGRPMNGSIKVVSIDAVVSRVTSLSIY